MGQANSKGKRSIRQSIKEHWREFAAASAGNALEFYDILIYGYFAITIGHLFFPNKDSAVSLLIAVGTFGISFITRPLGSVVLGSYADKAGRKASMTLSISLMVVGTAMITFCPTYETIGIWAPLIIIIARMLQGFSTGGEFGSSVAFLVEHAGIDKRGFFASFQMSTQGLATFSQPDSVLCSLLFSRLNNLTHGVGGLPLHSDCLSARSAYTYAVVWQKQPISRV